MAGYYRFPTIFRDTLVFVCEDDLWQVPASGGIARRLTANPGPAGNPAFSPDGNWLAFTGYDEGDPEAYVMPAEGGPARRLSYLSAGSTVVGWSSDGGEVILASDYGQPFRGSKRLFALPFAGGEPRELPFGLALYCSFGPAGGRVIARHSSDIARWKRYRGGLTGDIWIDPAGNGDWRRLLQLPGNLARPIWLGSRIYFLSDHEGLGNLYSCLPDGSDLQQHTFHQDFYARHPASDGSRIVYHAGADLFVFEPADNSSRRIEIAWHSPQPQRKRRFVDADDFLQGHNLRPDGKALAITSRGQCFSFHNFDGPVLRHGADGPSRIRLARWLHDGKRIALISDNNDEEALEIHTADGSAEPIRLNELDIGRPNALLAAPKQDLVALSNHRNEVLLIDLEQASLRVLAGSRHGRIEGMAFSPDGRWLAYGFPNTARTVQIRLCRLEDGENFAATEPLLYDVEPAFDPEGKYLYFISYRDFDPVFDALHFELGFPRGARPFLITLRKDLRSPFLPDSETSEPEKKTEAEEEPESGEETETPAEATESAETDTTAEEAQEEAKKDADNDKEKPLQIDLDGLSQRLIAFPVPIGRYGRIFGIKGKALFSGYPTEGSLSNRNRSQPRGWIDVYDFAEQNQETLVYGISDFALAQNHEHLLYRAGRRLRVIKAGEKPSSDNGSPRKSGWIDLDRVRVAVDPPAEWAQMYREAWRLQRDFFWTEDMSGVDWQAIYQRYLPLIERIGCRSEFSDLMWEMQGELGTSHAYEYGGDYRPAPDYDLGFLGADFAYDEASDSYRISNIVRGDVWNEQAGSPLARPGMNVQIGDRLTAINGRRLSRELTPGAALLHQAANEVLLRIENENGARNLTVRTLSSEMPARYRDWVEANRRYVHTASNGQAGYLHIPDMSARGFAEFHRGFLAEIARPALVVDVRFNGGGFVSQLLLEKRARRRLGYDVSRWTEPAPYPIDSLLGPVVALTNEQAGSDGDMFSHAFKLLRLGPLIGKRTWGGVIGISPRDTLLDGGVTTQPEFSIWFEDVQWDVENYGTEPTIEVDIRPQDYVAGQDPQLERAVTELLQLIEANPPRLPEFGNRPRRGV